MARSMNLRSAALACALLFLAAAVAPAGAAPPTDPPGPPNPPTGPPAGVVTPGRPQDVNAVANRLRGENASKFRRPTRGAAPIKDQYLFTFTDSSSAADRQALIDTIVANEGSIVYVGDTTWQGISARAPPSINRAARLLQKVVDTPSIRVAEADMLITGDQTVEPAGTLQTQSNPANWGIDRVDQRRLPLSQSYSYDARGSGVNIYMGDTGITFEHAEFQAVDSSGAAYNRAIFGFDAFNLQGVDCNGHGTHTSAIAAGKTYGVAKNATIYVVRVLNCASSGSWSGAIAGIDWITKHHQQTGTDCVVNLSLSGGKTVSVNDAITKSIAAGCTYTVAAGNNDADACNYTPASTPNAITVGGTASNDARYSYSNTGACLDIFAPGQAITSAWNTSTTATNTISGTSMAAPHVAGAAAQYLEKRPGSSPASVRDALVAQATTKVVTSAGARSPNLLLYMGFISSL